MGEEGGINSTAPSSPQNYSNKAVILAWSTLSVNAAVAVSTRSMHCYGLLLMNDLYANSSCYWCARRRVQQHAGKQGTGTNSGGAVRQALCGALHAELSDFYRLMAVLEAHASQPIPVPGMPQQGCQPLEISHDLQSPQRQHTCVTCDSYLGTSVCIPACLMLMLQVRRSRVPPT
jgi:hypothetical protein